MGVWLFSPRKKCIGLHLCLFVEIVIRLWEKWGMYVVAMPMDMPESAREFEIDLHGGPQSAHSSLSLTSLYKM
jgi:hypothetical protein